MERSGAVVEAIREGASQPGTGTRIARMIFAMRSRSRLLLCAALIALAAAVARAQDASRTAADDYRLRVVEPTEGLGVSGSILRVTVDVETRPRGIGGPGERATPTPAPSVEIFVDGAPQGAMPDGQRTVTVEKLPAGAHTLLVTASSTDGTVVDRKEVHFTILPPPPG